MNRIELPNVSGAYRWYYFDFSNEQYSAVCIFMLGSIFSARYSSSLKKGGLPREHAAVNFALYEKGSRWQWVLTEYQDVAVDLDARRLRIGNSTLTYNLDGTADVHIVDKTTPFMVTNWGAPVEAKLSFRPSTPIGKPLRLVEGASHIWQPIAPRGDMTLSLPQQELTVTGRGYHDGNHGDVPLGSDLSGWQWARRHHATATDITYQVWGGEPAWLVNASADGVTAARSVLPPPASRRSTWGLRVPESLGVADAPVMLESSPFYARLEAGSGQTHAMGEVADFARFHSPSVRWMSSFKTRVGGAS